MRITCKWIVTMMLLYVSCNNVFSEIQNLNKKNSCIPPDQYVVSLPFSITLLFLPNESLIDLIFIFHLEFIRTYHRT